MSSAVTATSQGSPLPSRRALRATAKSPSPLTQLARAVGDSAGSVGRQTATVAAVSGLAFSSTVMSAGAAQAATDGTGQVATVQDGHSVAGVNAPRGVELAFDAPSAEVVLKPAPKPGFKGSSVRESDNTDAAGESGAAKAADDAAAYARKFPRAGTGDNRQRDCYIFIAQTFAKAGVPFKQGQVAYNRANLKKGDVIYYDDNGFNGRQHFALYLGNGMVANGNWNHGGSSITPISLNGLAKPKEIWPQ